MPKKYKGSINLKSFYYLIAVLLISSACKSIQKYENTNIVSKIDCAQSYNPGSSSNEGSIPATIDQNIIASNDFPVFTKPKAAIKLIQGEKISIIRLNPDTSAQNLIANHNNKNFSYKNQSLKAHNIKNRPYLYIIISAALIGGLLIIFGYGMVLNSLLTIGIFLLLAIVFDLVAAVPYWTDDKMLLRKFYGRIAIISLIAGIILTAFLYLVIVIDLSFSGLVLIVLFTFLMAVAALSFAAAALAWLIMTIVEKRKPAQ